MSAVSRNGQRFESFFSVMRKSKTSIFNLFVLADRLSGFEKKVPPRLKLRESLSRRMDQSMTKSEKYWNKSWDQGLKERKELRRDGIEKLLTIK